LVLHCIQLYQLLRQYLLLLRPLGLLLQLEQSLLTHLVLVLQQCWCCWVLVAELCLRVWLFHQSLPLQSHTLPHTHRSTPVAAAVLDMQLLLLLLLLLASQACWWWGLPGLLRLKL
jgi:hypothetical protein